MKATTVCCRHPSDCLNAALTCSDAETRSYCLCAADSTYLLSTNWCLRQKNSNCLKNPSAKKLSKVCFNLVFISGCFWRKMQPKKSDGVWCPSLMFKDSKYPTWNIEILHCTQFRRRWRSRSSARTWNRHGIFPGVCCERADATVVRL